MNTMTQSQGLRPGQWIEYTGSPSRPVGVGKTEMIDGYWWHHRADGKMFCRESARTGAGARGSRSLELGAAGADYTPEGGNVLVDPKVADQTVLAGGGWRSPVPNGSWPGIMTQEAEKYAAVHSDQDAYVWCGENQKIYQLGTNGDLLADGVPEAGFDPVQPPGVVCKQGQVWDPIQGKCVTPSVTPTSVTQTWWEKIPLWVKLSAGGALVLATGAAVAVAAESKGPKRHKRR